MFFKIIFLIFVDKLGAATDIYHEPPQLRIIGGKESTPHIAPYMVYIEIDPHKIIPFPRTVQACGGSLITPQHVLTAAHCIESPKTVNFVIVGAHNVTKGEPSQQRIGAAKTKVHKDYNRATLKNDIGIIKLAQKVTLNNNVKLVSLPKASDASKTYVGSKVTTYGWGDIHEEPKAVETDVLMAIDLKVISNADCLKKAPKNDVYSGDICTDGTGRVGTCVGDSGGPLVVNGTQIGITSRGATDYCERGDPSVYARVTSYITWIEDTIKTL